MSLTFKKSKVHLRKPASEQSTICSLGRFEGQTQTLGKKKLVLLLAADSPSSRPIHMTLEEEEFDMMKKL